MKNSNVRKQKYLGGTEMDKKYKVIEWNINQRSGFGSRCIPKFVSEEIIEQKADVIVLTELFRCSNAEDFLKKTFIDNGYSFEVTTNKGTNEVVIAWLNSKFTKRGVDKSAVTMESNNVPNYLRVDLMELDGAVFSVVGARIRIVSYLKRKEEMRFVLEKLKEVSNPIILLGDFNNNRRSTIEPDWNLKVIDAMLVEEDFSRFTPTGQSIYQENAPRGYDYEFPEDHIMARDMLIYGESYDRDFVYKALEYYPWGKDFEYYDYETKRKESVRPGYPDHAIVVGYFERKVG